MLSAGEDHGGTCARPSIKGLRDFFSKIFPPLLTKRSPIGSHRGRVWVYVKGCVASTERTALGGERS